MEAASRRECELERAIREAQERHQRVEVDLTFWHRSGQELLRCAQDDGNAAAEAATESNRCIEQRAAEIEVLRRSCEDLEARLPEVQKIADATRLQEEQLRRRSEQLEGAVSRAETAAASARNRAADLLQQEVALCGERDAFAARVQQEVEAARRVVQAADGDGDEARYMKRRIQDKEREVCALEVEHSRLHTALQRHAGLEGGNHIDPGMLEVVERGPCGPFDEIASWVAMQLFKSVLVRRAFCVHLAVLYSWILFLLWWMSNRSQH